MTSRRPPMFQPRLSFQPQCTHLTMTRMYGLDFICSSCHRPGDFGWVYRCTQDRELLIERAAKSGYIESFDRFGYLMTRKMANITRKGSPAAREDKLSFLDEVTPQQMAQYRPEQVATILKQRDDLRLTLQREKSQANAAILMQLHRLRGGLGAADELELAYSKSWACRDDEECRFKICPHCRPSAADRAFLSLNAVVDGEIAPTAATGFGFDLLGERPVMSSKTLRTIGLRNSPRPSSEPSYTHSFSSSESGLMPLLNYQMTPGCRSFQSQVDQFDHRNGPTELPLQSPGHLKHSPAYENLTVINSPGSFIPQGGAVRPPWTPPPSPSIYGRQSSSHCHVLGLAAEPSITNGRSSNSLKTNPEVRNQLLTSVPSESALAHIQQTGHSTTHEHHVPYLPESAYDVGLTLPFDEEAFETARSTPLSDPDAVEDVYLRETPTAMMEYESEEGTFIAAPLQVENGVAVSEESVQLQVPDVITQL